MNGPEAGVDLEYDECHAILIAHTIKFTQDQAKFATIEQSHSQQHILQRGMKVFGRDRALRAATKELDQLHH